MINYNGQSNEITTGCRAVVTDERFKTLPCHYVINDENCVKYSFCSYELHFKMCGPAAEDQIIVSIWQMNMFRRSLLGV